MLPLPLRRYAYCLHACMCLRAGGRLRAQRLLRACFDVWLVVFMMRWRVRLPIACNMFVISIAGLFGLSDSSTTLMQNVGRSYYYRIFTARPIKTERISSAVIAS